jgi:hypothetical protein
MHFSLLVHFRFIIWRKANKIAIQLAITPDSELKIDDDVKIGFSMNFTYSTVPSSTPEKKDAQQRHALSSRVFITVGKIAAADAQ